jgi:hypothetical protein
MGHPLAVILTFVDLYGDVVRFETLARIANREIGVPR